MRMPEWPDRVESVQVVADVEPAFAKMKRETEAAGKECELIITILPQKSTQFYCKCFFALPDTIHPTFFTCFSGNQACGRRAIRRHHSSRADEERVGCGAERKDADGAESGLEAEHENWRNQLESPRR